MAKPLAPSDYRHLVGHALAEDIGSGDITTDAIVAPEWRARGVFVARRPCVVAGLDVAREAFIQVDDAVTMSARCRDGEVCRTGNEIAVVAGPAAALLKAERVSLNFLQHLSGIATLTRQFVDAARGRLTVLDTRKTIPTLRALAKYAVACGGGTNHRMGLHDGVLIKDNHIRIAGSIENAVRLVRGRRPGLPIEVEAQSLAEVDEAIAAGADVVMLDNLNDDEMRHAVARIAGRARVEISGGVTLDRVPALVEIGADCVSVGALTHSAPAADISFELEIQPAKDDRARGPST